MIISCWNYIQMSFFSKIVENNKNLAIGIGVAAAVAIGVGM